MQRDHHTTRRDGAFISLMAPLTGNILLPALRAHYVRPKSLPAILYVRFTSVAKHPVAPVPRSLQRSDTGCAHERRVQRSDAGRQSKRNAS